LAIARISQCFCMVTTTAVGPTLKVFEPNRSLVFVGKPKMGPTPQVTALDLDGERNKVVLRLPN